MAYETDEISSIKEAAIRFDIFIRDGGIGSSMFFVLLLLIIVNAHSLHFLFGDGVINWIFSVLGAIGFSIATTAVIRKPVSAWMKYLFPVFDTLLVFLGFNLLNEAIPVHFIMTVLFSLFTGAILISLGTINYKENSKLEAEKDSKIEAEALRTTIKRLETSLESDRTRLASVKTSLSDTIAEMELYKKVYYATEKSRILKKKPVNRTKNEANLLEKIMNSTI